MGAFITLSKADILHLPSVQGHCPSPSFSSAYFPRLGLTQSSETQAHVRTGAQRRGHVRTGVLAHHMPLLTSQDLIISVLV